MNRHMPPQKLTDYDADFYLWSERQAALIRERRFDELDIENIAEEIDSLGRSDRKALYSQMRRLLMHLLKWEFQKSRRTKSWRDTINSARMELEIILEDSPSLMPVLEGRVQVEYKNARKWAIREAGLPASKFPAECPYTAQQILDEDFWPGPAT